MADSATWLTDSEGRYRPDKGVLILCKYPNTSRELSRLTVGGGDIVVYILKFYSF